MVGFIKACIAWTILVLSALTFAAAGDPSVLASAKMLWLLAILWIGIFGLFTYAFRDKIGAWISKTSRPGKSFFIFATILLLAEEAVATFISNLNPYLGGTDSTKLLTASTNYLEIITFHSAVAIVPMFIVWALILKRYSFRPLEIMLVFGITGILAEFSLGGTLAVLMGGFWILVYGLMVYLPAYAFEKAERPRPKKIHFLAALIFPFVGALLVSLIF